MLVVPVVVDITVIVKKQHASGKLKLSLKVRRYR